MKNYFKVSFITLLSVALFYACSKDEGVITNKDQIQESAITSKTAANSALTLTICDITGTSVVSPNSAVVVPGSTVTYSYTNNTGTSGNIAWTTVTANPAGSITITGTGSTVSVTFSSTFISGSISAYGTGGTADACQSTLNITSSGGGTNCCQPTFDATYICGPGAKGAVLPFVSGCDVSNISQIVWDLGGAKWTAGPLAGQGGGTMVPPFSQYSKNIGQYNCNYGTFRITATYYFNNGCPSSTYYVDVTPSN